MIPGSLRTGQRWPGLFGPPDRQLFACHHLPYSEANERQMAVVLCYPLGQEYMRSHRAYLHLANGLAVAGFHAGRFEYFGTGDSAGEEDEVSLDDWVGDVELTLAETWKATHCRQVALVGLRFGAALAMQAAVGRGDVSAAVFWDPVVTGSTYLEELRKLHQERLWTHFHQQPEAQQPEDHKQAERPTELVGLKLNEQLYHQIETLDLMAIQTKPMRSALVIDSRGDPAVERFAGHLQDLGVRATFQHIPGFSIWTEDTDKGLVPTQAIQAIVSWFEELHA